MILVKNLIITQFQLLKKKNKYNTIIIIIVIITHFQLWKKNKYNNWFHILVKIYNRLVNKINYKFAYQIAKKAIISNKYFYKKEKEKKFNNYKK